ncbi:hypothetical protein BDP27DRAFT_1496629 [Rhodocollybia butyracea]|uniref:Uncharacterized protein n=1 Tax=Rhodocollybia butyracea TaxID=206335 RepID=A0A9P5UAH1_9AGAR|nr:hypothetical protein BDP27DRAFT_1496629 [Rhodocollybia butyracea]
MKQDHILAHLWSSKRLLHIWKRSSLKIWETLLPPPSITSLWDSPLSPNLFSPNYYFFVLASRFKNSNNIRIVCPNLPENWASDLKEDGWMATDTAMTVALTSAATKTEQQVFFEYGKDGSDLIEVCAPKNVVVVNNSVDLKNTFLGAVKRITAGMNTKDVLIIFIAAHDCGDIIIGTDTLLSKDELKEAMDTKNQRILLWSTSRYGEFWLEDVPWSGYVAEKPTKNLESLAALGANHCWGVRDLASSASTIRNELEGPYEANISANEETRSSLFFPCLTDDILGQFRLVGGPSNRLVPSPLSAPPARSSQKASDTMREIMHARTFEWPSEVDKDELIELATPLLDCEPMPTSCNLQRIRRNLLNKDSSPGDVQILWSIFKQHMALGAKRVHLAGASSGLIWEQLARAWDSSGRPSFSFEEFQSVITGVHISKSERIRTQYFLHGTYIRIIDLGEISEYSRESGLGKVTSLTGVIEAYQRAILFGDSEASRMWIVSDIYVDPKSGS